MSNRAQGVLKILFFAVLAAVFVFYGIQRSQTFRAGPKIIVEYPPNGLTASEPWMEFRGKTENISMFYFNGRQIFTDKEGNFKESLLLARGYNIIEIKAVDKFNRETKVLRELVLK